MCRRQSGAAFLTFARYLRRDVRFIGRMPTEYRSSSRVLRGFCVQCGSSLSFAYDFEPEQMFLTVGTFDLPETLEGGQLERPSLSRRS
jgi:hypothetical protein